MISLRCAVNLLEPGIIIQNVRYLSNKSAIITKVHRKMFLKLYPTMMVQPDGSTFTFRHYEPRKIVKLPIDISKLSEEERSEFLERRKPKKKVVVEEIADDDFSFNQYLKLMKKN